MMVHIFFPESASGWNGVPSQVPSRDPNNDVMADLFPSVEMLNGEHLQTMLEDRRICSQFPDVEGYYFTVPHDAHEALTRIVTQGLLGPIDVWIGWANNAVPEQNWQEMASKDVFEDLSPHLLSDISDYNFEGVPSFLRDTFLRDGASVVGLPLSTTVYRFMHTNDQSFVNLPPVASWDEYLAELDRLEAERASGSDKFASIQPFCLLGYGQSEETDSLLRSSLVATIASSFLQVKGPEDLLEVGAGQNMLPLFHKEGWEQSAHIFLRLLNHSVPHNVAPSSCMLMWGRAPTVSSTFNFTVVGSWLVHNRKADQSSRMLTCITTIECPASVAWEGHNQRIVPAQPVITSVTQVAIERRSNKKNDAWKFLLYLQSDDVYLSNLAQGAFSLIDPDRVTAAGLYKHISERMPQLHQSGLIVDMPRAISLLESLRSVQLSPTQSMMAMINTFTGPAFRIIYNELAFVADNLYCMRYADFGTLMCSLP